MDADAFAAVHADQWDELDALRRRRRLTPEESDRFVLLYQRAATHLSQVRTASGDPATLARLSMLVARSRARLVAPREPAWREVATFVTVSFPAALWRTRWWTAACAAASVVVAAATAAWVLGDPAVLAAVGTPAELRSYVDEEFSGYYSAHPAGAFAAHVWTNNAWITAQCIAFGVSGVWVLVVLAQNALNLGVSAGLMLSYHRGQLFFSLILPHGLLELTCVFVAAGAGLMLFWAWVVPGPRTRAASLAAEGRALITVAIGLVGVLAISGCLEAFLTPSPLPTAVRIGIGALVWAAFLAYAGVLGRRAVASGQNGDLREDLAGDAAPVAS